MTTESTQAMLDDRYGRSSARSRRTRWIVLAVIAAALVGYLGWTTITRTMNQVDYDTTGFRKVDDHQITVDFQVTTQPDTAVACAIEAQDTEHGIVGWKVVEYPADPAHTRRFSETVPTTALATTGLVTSCWIP